MFKQRMSLADNFKFSNQQSFQRKFTIPSNNNNPNTNGLNLANLKRLAPDPASDSKRLSIAENSQTDILPNPEVAESLKSSKKMRLNEQIEKRKRSIENFFNHSLSWNDSTYNLRDILSGADKIIVDSKPKDSKQEENLSQKNQEAENVSFESNKDFLSTEEKLRLKLEEEQGLNSFDSGNYVYPNANYQRIEKSNQKRALVQTIYGKPISSLDNFQKNIEDRYKFSSFTNNGPTGSQSKGDNGTSNEKFDQNGDDQGNFDQITKTKSTDKTLASLVKFFNQKLVKNFCFKSQSKYR
jgi:hypothetical protein